MRERWIRRLTGWGGALLLLGLCLCPAAAVTTSTEGTPPPEDETLESGKGPFSLLSCSVARGETGVATNVLIQLDFGRNVVNISVLEHNAGCFHLANEAGDSVPVRLLFPDDQLQRAVKRTVFLQPVEPLAAESRYVLAVDNALLAKNGTRIDQAYQISFTTGGEQAAQENAVLEELGDQMIALERDTPMSERSIDGSVYQENGAYHQPYDSYAGVLPEAGMVARVLAAAALCLMGGISAALLWTRRRCA